MASKAFAQEVYRALRQVPKGRVTTYKALAEAVDSRAYRAIGQIMRTNPDAPHTPCHRVVSSTGEVGGFMGDTAGKNIQRKIQLLQQEGVGVMQGQVQQFEKLLFTDFH